MIEKNDLAKKHQQIKQQWGKSATCKLGDQLTLQRGFDITKQQCAKRAFIPSSRPEAYRLYHSEYKTLGPGVLLGRRNRLHPVDIL